MKEPATERAVQTTPPMIRAAAMPALPFRPTATRIREAMINVMRVMPLTGFVPTIAIALAATVVKRNDMMPTISRPTIACQILLTTPPKAKKANTAKSAMTIPNTMVFIGISSSVRRAFASLWMALSPLLAGPLNSLTASPTADLMTPNDLMIPMIPAVAMPPIPICLA